MRESPNTVALKGNGPVAVVFPGQGAQRSGMGSDLHARFEVARRVFEEASDATGLDVAELCFGDDPRLHRTEVTQPCLLTVEYAAYRVAVEEFGLEAQVFGGHSLGEYTALLAAGALPLSDAVALVRMRGQLMADTVPPGEGGMAALLMDSIETSEALAIVAAVGAEIANHNSPHQVAISGSVEHLEEVRRILERTLPDLDFVRLKVGAPFHSRRMRAVVGRLLEHLESHRGAFRLERAAQVVSNLTGDFHVPDRLLGNLAEQAAAPVRWLDNMAALSRRAERVLELGPRGSLSKFFRASGRQATPLTTVLDLETHLGSTAHGPVTSPAARPALPAPAAAARYVVGGMGWGIGASPLVSRAAGAGFLAFLGSTGVACDVLAREIIRIQETLPERAPWGLNITRNLEDPSHTERLIDLALQRRVPALELAGFRRPTPALVRARLIGLSRDADGRPRPARRILVKVSDESTARSFLAPPPPQIVADLVASGDLDPRSAELANRTPMADDVCAAPVWGEDPTFQAALLLPVLLDLAKDRAESWASGLQTRIGLAGGLGSPESIAAAFAQGAEFVLTGSVNQCTIEARLGDEAKALLAKADIGDFGFAPTADRFELGGRVQVLQRGLSFAARANRIEQLWRRYGSLAAMPVEERRRVESVCGALGNVAKPGADDDPATTIDMIRHWLEDTLRLAVDGDAPVGEDLQIQSGPAIAAFNRATRGLPLADWRRRHVDDVGRFLLEGATQVLARQGMADDRTQHDRRNRTTRNETTNQSHSREQACQ